MAQGDKYEILIKPKRACKGLGLDRNIRGVTDEKYARTTQQLVAVARDRQCRHDPTDILKITYARAARQLVGVAR